ncbi:alpha/beta hydrolase family protein [Spirosoma rhododendri]|uniref:Alpha/beta hydrolase n=1 Tax=Spirosoma rhododendri TaxID=2728024 RepID=A0A7L5DPI1_9BACT|nr:alpha/beta fold hydrolase [Spirosoma rhododendri]QJD79492.1 alpha/beta hydrolase [Spirosoma rhododendri]
MSRLLLLLLLGLTGTVLAQTSEPIHYVITQPAGVSLTLDGTLTLPANATGPVPVVLLIAGSGPTDRDSNSPVPVGGKTVQGSPFRMLADSLSRQGVAVARYDKRYSGTNAMVAVMKIKQDQHRFDYYVSDAVGLIRQLQADKRFSRVVVAGHSEGSLVGMLAATQTNADAFVSLAGSGHNIADVLKLQLAKLPDSQRDRAYRDLDSLRAGQTVKEPPMLVASFFAPSVQPYLMSWMKYDPAIEIMKFRGPVLLINGKRDLQSGVTEADALKAARPDARLLLYPNMTHMLKDAAGESTPDNFKTYHDPSLPLTPGLATAIAQFVRGN